MWKLVGMAMLMSRVVMASTSEAYYTSERDEDGGPEGMEIPSSVRVGGLVAPESTRRVNEDENEAASREQSPQQRQSENASLLDYSKLKSETKRPIARVNLIDDGSSRHRVTSVPLATLLYWPDRDQISSAEANERNPRSPGRVNTPFSPWGGKRDLERYKTIAKTRRPVRVPFNSWGGKRNGEVIDSIKRDALLNWEGKKTPPFNSWGGKRTSIAARLGYDSRCHPTDSEDSEDDDFRSFRHLENAQRLQQPQKFTNYEKSIKRISSRLLSREGEITTSGSTPLGDDSPRVPSWASYRRGQLRYGDDGTHSAGFSLSFRKIGPLVPTTE